MNRGDIFYIAYPEKVQRVTFLENGDDGRNFKRRKHDPVVVDEDGDRLVVERENLYTDPLAAAIVSSEMQRKLEETP